MLRLLLFFINFFFFFSEFLHIQTPILSVNNHCFRILFLLLLLFLCIMFDSLPICLRVCYRKVYCECEALNDFKWFSSVSKIAFSILALPFKCTAKTIKTMTFNQLWFIENIKLGIKREENIKRLNWFFYSLYHHISYMIAIHFQHKMDTNYRIFFLKIAFIFSLFYCCVF